MWEINCIFISYLLFCALAIVRPVAPPNCIGTNVTILRGAVGTGRLIKSLLWHLLSSGLQGLVWSPEVAWPGLTRGSGSGSAVCATPLLSSSIPRRVCPNRLPYIYARFTPATVAAAAAAAAGGGFVIHGAAFTAADPRVASSTMTREQSGCSSRDRRNTMMCSASSRSLGRRRIRCAY